MLTVWRASMSTAGAAAAKAAKREVMMIVERMVMDLECWVGFERRKVGSGSRWMG
jgi:hypothetical protein